MNMVPQDIRFALRQLRKAPGFTLTATLTLALGIGATATMYSIVSDVLLAPLPYPDRDSLVGVAFTFPQEKPNAEQAGSSADFITRNSRSFQSTGIADDSSSGANLSSASETSRPVQVSSTMVSQGYFPTLGIKPILGRTFTFEEDLPGGPKVALLSYWVWRRTFGGDPHIVNRVVRINEEPYTVVGVLPQGITGSPQNQGDTTFEGVWLPLRLSPKDPGYDGDNYIMVARLRQGATLSQVQQEMDALKTPFYARFPSYKTWTTKGKLLHEFRVWPLQSVLVSEVRRSLLVLFAAVAAVLLVACLNLAGLMMARASRRHRELALRAALGATRGSLLRLLACESFLLALAGGVLGLALEAFARPALLAASPLALPLLQAHHSDWGVFAYVAAVAVLTTMVCGLVPAWAVFRQDARTLVSGNQSTGDTQAQARTARILLIGQVALSMVLLSGASLLLGSFLKLRSTSSGVDPAHLQIAQVSLKGAAYENALHTSQFVDKVVGTLAHYPGVQRVAAINGLPLDRGLNTGGRPEGRRDLARTIEFRIITPGYIRTIGIPLLAGRDIAATDSAGTSRVVLVSETAARKWWPGKSPIGERVVVGSTETWTVVGVVEDIHSRSLAEAPRVMIYAPFAQISDSTTKAVNGWFSTTFAIRLSADLDLAAAVQSAIENADPEIPVARLTSMQSVIDSTIAGPRFFSWMASGFALFALLLTVIGIFGLLSYQVTQRTREIGVRLAIGSTREEILLLILKRGLMLTTVGLGLGAIASLAIPKVVTSLLDDNLFTGGAGIDSTLAGSATALGFAALAMLLAATLASYLPAHRAASTQPMQALRAE